MPANILLLLSAFDSLINSIFQSKNISRIILLDVAMVVKCIVFNHNKYNRLNIE